jgi:hypothetical protein
MKTQLTLLLILGSQILNAQPTITNGSGIVTSGNSFPCKFATIADIGSIGANQTWDFSQQIFSNLGSCDIVDVSTTYFATDFPTANWSFTVGPWTSYFEITPSEMNNQALNISSTSGAGDYRDNPRKVLQFPFDFLDSYVDTYMEGGSSNDLTVTYEGYGTLIMPDGFTYTNVVRVREEESNGVVLTKFYTVQPLMNIAMHFSSNTVLSWVQTPVNLGIEEMQEGRISVYPNPANDLITLTLSESSSGTLTVYAADGRKLLTQEINDSSAETIDMSSFAEGLYYIHFGSLVTSFVKE